MPKTMTHTPAQRKDWHDGKARGHEDKFAWFRRVIVRNKNYRGANTPPVMKRGLFYNSKGGLRS